MAETNLNNRCIIFPENTSIEDKKRVELILLSYDNIEWNGTGKRQTGKHIEDYLGIVIKHDKLYVISNEFEVHHSRLKYTSIDMKEFINKY